MYVVVTHFLQTFNIQYYSGKEDGMGYTPVIDKVSSPAKPGRRCVSCMCLYVLSQVVKNV